MGAILRIKGWSDGRPNTWELLIDGEVIFTCEQSPEVMECVEQELTARGLPLEIEVEIIPWAEDPRPRQRQRQTLEELAREEYNQWRAILWNLDHQQC